MKKQLVIIGIVAILVCVGLSGCSNIGVTNIGDIQANPQKYLDKEVTVEGACGGNTIRDDNGHFIMFQYSTIITGRYRLTGIIRYSDTFLYYLNVTKAVSI